MENFLLPLSVGFQFSEFLLGFYSQPELEFINDSLSHVPTA